MTDTTVLCSVLREEREHYVMTKEEMAVRLDVNGGRVITGWEKGETSPDLGRFVRWADALGFRVALIRKA